MARAPRQLALYRYLAEASKGGASLPLAQVLAETGASRASLDALAARGLVEISQVEVWRDPLAGREFVLAEAACLTPDQERVLARLAPVLDAREHHTFLLHGVTGSGKTEIYLQAASRVLAQGRRVILLVPEIALTPQTIRRVAARFPGRVGVWHSRLGEGQRYDQWRRIMAGAVDVVVGARSAILLPVADPGLIVVDEEHESSYKQETTPRYHAREAAVALGALCGACVILGSATPDVVSAQRAAAGLYTRLLLPQRVLSHRRHVEEQRAQQRLPERRLRLQPVAEGARDLLYAPLPPVQVVDLRRELREGNRSIFSRALQSAMARALADREQVILFLNRRGSATFVLCRDCGHTLTCPRCDVSLTYHGAEQELLCHHCHYRQPQPRTCPRCLGRRIRYFGLGTQRVVEEVRALFPDARVVRWDRDATRERGSHEELLRQFVEHEADVMVGTQMIAKGLDLPLVTLVGVVSADTALHLADYRAAERTFQLLTQVAGRAGRSPLGGRVIVQTYTPEHYAIRAASRHDYEGFLRQELPFRRRHGYPPFARLVRLVYADEDASRARQRAAELAEMVGEHIRGLGLPGVEVIGPAPCPLRRLHGRWRWQLILRAAEPHAVLSALALP
ncbi:MAG: primosomal protein N', partial [Anaerolineae bacterium]|nr:primosomal protein N' [Anaerolineae bacterium]